MPRTKGSKNKPKAPKAKAKKASAPKGPARASTVAAKGVQRDHITENDLTNLLESCQELQGKQNKIGGTIREKISYAVEHQHLNKGVFSWIRKLDKMDPEELALFMEDFDHYFVVSGLEDKAKTAPTLPGTRVTQPDPKDGEGTNVRPFPGGGTGTEPKAAAASA